MPDSITVWPNNNADHPMSVDWNDALEAFGHSFYPKPKATPTSIEERVHSFIEGRYGIFVAPDSVDARGYPSMSADAYRRFMRAAEQKLA